MRAFGSFALWSFRLSLPKVGGWNGLSFFLSGPSAAVGVGSLKESQEIKVTSMKSNEIRTIFSVYQIWLAEEKERIAADLREVCEAGQTKRQWIEKSDGGDAVGRACEFRAIGGCLQRHEVLPNVEANGYPVGTRPKSGAESDQQEREGRTPARARRSRPGFLPTPPSPP
jgi:hypothetical protein